MAGILANNKTGIEAAGKNRLDTASANQQQRLAVTGINNDIGKFNSEGMLKADMANQDAFSRAKACLVEDFGLCSCYDFILIFLLREAHQSSSPTGQVDKNGYSCIKVRRL